MDEQIERCNFEVGDAGSVFGKRNCARALRPAHGIQHSRLGGGHGGCVTSRRIFALYKPPCFGLLSFRSAAGATDTTDLGCRYGNPQMWAHCGVCCGIRPHFNWVIGTCEAHQGLGLGFRVYRGLV